ncbi:unnamed protein product [Gadus morhua 'NCC']
MHAQFHSRAAVSCLSASVSVGLCHGSIQGGWRRRPGRDQLVFFVHPGALRCRRPSFMLAPPCRSLTGWRCIKEREFRGTGAEAK